MGPVQERVLFQRKHRAQAQVGELSRGHGHFAAVVEGQDARGLGRWKGGLGDYEMRCGGMG